jgi:uncharacterized membrane protein YphA (DoxX/SURF4 family)
LLSSSSRDIIMAIVGLVLGALLILVALLTWVSVYYLAEAKPGSGVSFFGYYFLILLRLAIGWHFLIEGLDKVKSHTWSGEAYLREAQGPLAPQFRELAGDRLLDKLTVSTDGAISDELDVDLATYRDAVIAFYELDSKQAERAQTAVNEMKKVAGTWLQTRPRKVEVTVPPALRYSVSMKMPARLKKYEEYQTAVEAAEQAMLDEEPNAPEQLKIAKANLRKWRADLQRDLGRIDKEMKRSLRLVLVEIALEDLPGAKTAVAEIRKKQEEEAKKTKTPADDWEAEEVLRDKNDTDVLQALRSEVIQQQAKKTNLKAVTDKIADQVLRPVKGKFTFDLVPEPPVRPVASWTMLDWSDAIVKYGTLGVGACLLLGLFTRLACVVGATFLLLFFLAMPPLPGWPESPRAEGHYLYINKNIIEMLALLALAGTRSGRWVGLDGLLQFINPVAWRAGPPQPRKKNTEPLPIFPGVGKVEPKPAQHAVAGPVQNSPTNVERN